MSVSSQEKALQDAGFSRPGDALREIAEGEGEQEAFDWGDEPSLLEQTAARLPRSDFGYMPPQKRGGRPSGAKGKATRELMATMDRLGFKDPLIAAAEVISTDYDTLAKILGCERLEAFDRWFGCVKFLADYKHQKTPVQINAQGVPLVPIQINLGGGAGDLAAHLPDNLRGLTVIAPGEENQGVSAAAAAKVARSEGRTDD